MTTPAKARSARAHVEAAEHHARAAYMATDPTQKQAHNGAAGAHQQAAENHTGYGARSPEFRAASTAARAASRAL